MKETVKEIASRPCITIGADKTFAEAAKIMRDKGITEIVVVQKDKTFAGIINITDVLQAVAENMNPKTTKVMDIMVEKGTALTLEENDSLDHAVNRMCEFKLKGAPVLNGRNEPVAFLTTKDISEKVKDPKRYLDRIHSHRKAA